MSKPNIIFILTDQQRYDTLGVYGQYFDATPNLDNLARSGVIFTHAFTCQPLCGPNRSVIQTGRYPTETGCFRNNIKLPLTEKTIAEYLTEVGYRTAYIGKWHLATTLSLNIFKIDINQAVPEELRGGYKDYWLASNSLEFTSEPFHGHLFDKNMNEVKFKGYRVDALTDFVLEYLDNTEYISKEPFLLFISYLEPHHEEFPEKFVGPPGSKKKFSLCKTPEDLNHEKSNWIESYSDYLGSCWSIDKNYKRIENKLKELKIFNNTIIIYTSDHGCHFKTRENKYKRSCHDSSIRVPLIISGKKFIGGKRISELVSSIDLAPTILKIAGISIPKYMKGKPLQALIDNPNDWRDAIFIQISESQVGRAIRTRRWKYSVRAPFKHGWISSDSKVYIDDYLYDLKMDPYEQNNLIEDIRYFEIRNKLKNLLINKMAEAGESIPKIKSKYKTEDINKLNLLTANNKFNTLIENLKVNITCDCERKISIPLIYNFPIACKECKRDITQKYLAKLSKLI